MLEVHDFATVLVLVGAALGWMLMLLGLVYMANRSFFRRAAPPAPPPAAEPETQPDQAALELEQADRPMAVVIVAAAPRHGRDRDTSPYGREP